MGVAEEGALPKIDVKDAVRIADSVVQDLYSGIELRDLLLEEVELSGGTWLVTIGFTPPNRSSGLGALVAPPRVLKRIKIDAETGEFMGMQIRNLQLETPGQYAD